MGSVDFTQLNGEKINLDRAKTKCTKKVTNKDGGKTSSYGGSSLNQEEVMRPCGLHAALMPVEGFELSKSGGNKVSFETKNINPSGVKGKKFKNAPDSKTTQWADIENGIIFFSFKF